ncbi:MAG: ribonuclease HII [Candidatus Marinimicrobia bacterium]|nr:ribonuclease HII [Candidatus Neomarinimicrobiota bacterium]
MAKKTLNLDIEKKYWIAGKAIIAGIDEAGRGPLAGPVVSAAVVFGHEHSPIKGVFDSKKISEKSREILYDKIIEQAKAVGIGVVDNKTIDEINILNATYKAMRMAIGKTRVSVDFILVDGRPLKNSILPQEAIISGDSKCYSIAAASIVAKVYRDRLMFSYDKIFPQYGLAKHKGYGTREHCEAIEKFGASPIHRISFQKVAGFDLNIIKITNHRTLGAIGENHAAFYLYNHGYEIVERNFHFSTFGEIDIIAMKSNVLVFVEVKTIRDPFFGAPELKVDEAKQQQIFQIAEAFLAGNNFEDHECRFDVIAITIENNSFKINHIEDAFQL